jgi:ADP-heptose:LPS heptosyltransferase
MTGLMHAAAALDPSAGICGSSSTAYTPPPPPQARILSLNLSAALLQRECPLGHLNA